MNQWSTKGKLYQQLQQLKAMCITVTLPCCHAQIYTHIMFKLVPHNWLERDLVVH